MNFENKDVAFAIGFLQSCGYKVEKILKKDEPKDSLFEGMTILGSCATAVPRGCGAGYQQVDPTNWTQQTSNLVIFATCCQEIQKPTGTGNPTKIYNLYDFPIELFIYNKDFYPSTGYIHYTLKNKEYADLTDWPLTPTQIQMGYLQNGKRVYLNRENFGRQYQNIVISPQSRLPSGYQYNPQTSVGWSN